MPPVKVAEAVKKPQQVLTVALKGPDGQAPQGRTWTAEDFAKRNEQLAKAGIRIRK